MKRNIATAERGQQESAIFTAALVGIAEVEGSRRCGEATDIGGVHACGLKLDMPHLLFKYLDDDDRDDDSEGENDEGEDDDKGIDGDDCPIFRS